MRIGLNSPQAVLALLIRRRWWIIAPFVALSCIVVVLTKSLPKTYVSSTLILVEPRDVPQNFVVDLISGTVEERLRSIEQTVLSRTNIVLIAREFGGQLPELKNLDMDQKVAKLQSQISISFQGGDKQVATGKKPITYFRISYQNQSPALAQKIASKLTQLFIEKDTNTRESQVSGTKDFFQRQLDKVEEQLKASAAQLQEMKSRRQYELPERLQTNLARLDSLTQQLRTTEEAIGRNTTLRLTYQQMMDAVPPTIAKVIPTAGRPSAMSAATTPVDQKILDYRRAKQDYEQASSINPPLHPDVRTKKVIWERLREKLSPEDLATAEMPPTPPAQPATPEVPGLPAGTEPNQKYQSLAASLAQAETEYKILLNQKTDTQNQIVVFSHRIENTPQAEQELAAVLRENQDLQAEYNGLKTKLQQAELSVSLESEQKGGNFTVVDPANKPVNPTKPDKAMVALGGTAVSLVLSLIFATIVDIARQRIWTQAEIEAFWSVPVLVDIPQILTDSDLAAAKKKKWYFAASAAGAAMLFSICLYGVDLKHEYILRQLDPVLQRVIYKQ